MIQIPLALSPLGQSEDSAVLAAGPFIVQVADASGVLLSPGNLLIRLDDQAVEWQGDYPHTVHPTKAPVVQGNAIFFTQAEDGAQYVIRPVETNDSYLAGVSDDFTAPTDSAAGEAATHAIALLLQQLLNGEAQPPGTAGEDNLYLTRDQSGKPLALIKMSSSHPILARVDGVWRQLQDDELDLLGSVDTPVRAGAVAAWDSGNLQQVGNYISDDRFGPQDALELYVELSDSDHVERLLLRRSRGRIYSRVNGRWALAQPNPEAATVDVTWSAVGAWDDGDLAQLAQVQDYDVDGDQAA